MKYLKRYEFFDKFFKKKDDPTKPKFKIGDWVKIIKNQMDENIETKPFKIIEILTNKDDNNVYNPNKKHYHGGCIGCFNSDYKICDNCEYRIPNWQLPDLSRQEENDIKIFYLLDLNKDDKKEISKITGNYKSYYEEKTLKFVPDYEVAANKYNL